MTSPSTSPVNTPEVTRWASACRGHFISGNLACSFWDGSTLVVPALALSEWIGVRVAIITTFKILADFEDAAGVQSLISTLVDILASWVAISKGNERVTGTVASASVDSLIGSISLAKVTDSTRVVRINDIMSTKVEWIFSRIAIRSFTNTLNAPTSGTETWASDFIDTLASYSVVDVVSWADAASDVSIHIANSGTDSSIKVTSVSAADEF